MTRRPGTSQTFCNMGEIIRTLEASGYIITDDMRGL